MDQSAPPPRLPDIIPHAVTQRHVPEASVLLRKMKRNYVAFGAASLLPVLLLQLLSFGSTSKFLGGAVMESSMMAKTTTTANMVTTRDDRYYWNGIIKQDYEWLGDHWIPVTDGVPTYTIDDIISKFGKYNILWMGDSTSRQSYTAVLAMMEVPPRLSGDGNANRYIPMIEMERRKNVNKGRVDENCTLRNFANTSVLGARYNPGTLRCKQSPLGNGKRYDLDSGLACLKDTTQFLELERSGTLTPMLPDYDVVIVQHGIWEVERQSDCHRGLNNTVEMRLQTSLDSLQKVASPHLTIIWQTHGHTGHSTNRTFNETTWLDIGPRGPRPILRYKQYQRNYETTRVMHEVAREWFERNQPIHMYLVDWGKQVIPRSWGTDRNEGDMMPHWGLAARLLGIQMVTHALYVMEEDKKNERTSL